MTRLESLLTRKGFYEFVISKKNIDQLNDEDLQFIESLRKTISLNYSNPEFGIEQLSDELSMTYLKLFRKLKKLTHKNAKTLLQEYRMSTALNLLNDNSIPLHEIADKVGFNSQSNFNAYFKKYFNCTPSKIQKRVNNFTASKTTIQHSNNIKLLITTNHYLSFSIKEKNFFDKVFQEIWVNLSEDTYSAKQAAQNLFISYSQLNRKLIKLCHLSLGQLILIIRLEHAAKLLRNTKGHIKEIAYQVGFNESSHFSKSFKKRFKVSPIEYRRAHSN